MKLKVLACIFLFTILNSTALSEGYPLRVQWNAPCYDEANERIIDLKGFRIYATTNNVFVKGTNVIHTFTNSVVMAPVIQGTNSNGEAYGELYETTVEVSNSYWYAMTAFDIYRNESEFSESFFVNTDIPKRPKIIYLEVK